MAEEVADRTEILRLLSAAGRKGHVPALRLLLAELKRDEASEAEETGPELTVVPDAEDFIEELAKRAQEDSGTDAP